MLKALWFLLKTALLVAVIVWAVGHDGAVRFEWQGWQVETTVGFVAAVFLVFLALYTLLYRLWRGVVAVPAVYRRYQQARRREQGYADVTRGLVAVAAGDARAARKYASRAQGLVPDAPLAQLLLAQSFQLSEKPAQAREAFAALLDDDRAAFFGIKGLLQESLHAGDVRGALDYIRQADALQPRRAWIVRTLFDLETRNGVWDRAEKVLHRAAKMELFDPQTLIRHRQAILLARADDAFGAGDVVAAHRLARRAFRLDPAFTPAGLRLVRYYMHVGKKKSAFVTIEKAFAAAPHPELVEQWLHFLPDALPAGALLDKNKAAYDWVLRLHNLNPEHPESLRVAGLAAVQAGHMADARDYFLRAGDYAGLAQVEARRGGDTAQMRAWLEQAAAQPLAFRWLCGSCGHTAVDWAPLCRQCGSFDTLSWTAAVAADAGHHVRAALPAGAPDAASDVLAAPAVSA